MGTNNLLSVTYMVWKGYTVNFGTNMLKRLITLGFFLFSFYVEFPDYRLGSSEYKF